MKRRGPRPVSERLRRLLIMLPWLMERGEATVVEMTERFAIGEDELIRDLELAAMCGLPPYLDEVIDLYVDEGVVHAGIPRIFDRPFRLTAPEGFALLAAARTAIEVSPADAADSLNRALDKLEAALGRGGLAVDHRPPDLVDDLVAAAARGEQVAIRHWSATATEATARTITPRAVFQDRGYWYVQADDRLRGEERVFRIDRIESMTPTGVIDEPRAVDPVTARQWFADSDLPVVTLRLTADAVGLIDQYPTESLTVAADGSAEVQLRVTSEHWLDGILLWLGARAEVLDPAEWRDRGARAAALLRRRYA